MGDSSQVGAVSNSETPSNRVQGPAAAPTQPVQNNYAAQGTGLIGASLSAYAAYTAGRANQKVARANADAARVQATQAVALGEFQANRIEERGRIAEGANAAATAAGGTVVGAGTNRAVTASNQAVTEMDKYYTRLNARREAYGYTMRGAAHESAGDAAMSAGKEQATEQVLAGASGAWLESDRATNGGRLRFH